MFDHLDTVDFADDGYSDYGRRDFKYYTLGEAGWLLALTLKERVHSLSPSTPWAASMHPNVVDCNPFMFSCSHSARRGSGAGNTAYGGDTG